ncbi:hypothetical protein J4212_00265 [Candidatus Woesearchaeota archaeon]|nr:hypothetical protein [Candidatus Woesearchaeota archaeon]
MTDVLVSIRMPKSLLDELKQLAKEQHFLDLSEQLRSIVRKEWAKAQSPELFQLNKLRQDIEKETRKTSEEKVREQINKELEAIKEQLMKGGMLK